MCVLTQAESDHTGLFIRLAWCESKKKYIRTGSSYMLTFGDQEGTGILMLGLSVLGQEPDLQSWFKYSLFLRLG